MGPTTSLSDKFPSCAGKYPQNIILYILGCKGLLGQQKEKKKAAAVAFCLTQCRENPFYKAFAVPAWSVLSVGSCNLMSSDSLHLYQPVSSLRAGTVFYSPYHSFSIAVVTQNCHKLRGLKSYPSGGQKRKTGLIGLKVRGQQDWVVSGCSRRESITALSFSASGQYLNSLACGLIFVFKANNNTGLRSFYVALSLVLLLLLPFSTNKRPVTTVDPPE